MTYLFGPSLCALASAEAIDNPRTLATDERALIGSTDWMLARGLVAGTLPEKTELPNENMEPSFAT
jgi:hypothetical protein